MAQMNGYILTTAGKKLLAKVRTGLRLSFTKVVFGDGQVASGTDIRTLTALVSLKQSFSIYDIQTEADQTTVLSVIMTNAGLSTGYYIREIGLMAQDPEDGSKEILYAISTAAEADFMPAAGANTMVSNTIKLHVSTNDAANITVSLDMEAYASKNYVLNHTYPIGAIFISTVKTSPAELIGGTWSALPEGRLLMAQGNNYPAGQMAGSTTHTISLNEMPRHEHSLRINEGGNHQHYSIDGFGETGWDTTNGGEDLNGYPLRIAYGDNHPWRDNVRAAITSAAGYHAHSGTANANGGGAPMSIMPPYISVYMWQRTA